MAGALQFSEPGGRTKAHGMTMVKVLLVAGCLLVIGALGLAIVVKKSILIFFAALLPACALSAGEPFDLSKIDHFCPKGRVQDEDYNRHLPLIDALIEK